MPSLYEERDLLGVHAVVFDFPAMDGSHIEGVAQEKSYSNPLAQIGQPIPGKNTLAPHHEIVLKGPDEFQKGSFGAGEILFRKGLVLGIGHMAVHGLGVEVDAAVVLVGL
jgi:hypothetical protein